MTSLPPAGWYPDSETGGAERYWTGTAWAPKAASTLTAEEPGAFRSAPFGEQPPLQAAAPAAPSVRSAPVGGNAMATAALVLGIIALVLGLIPFVGFLTWTIAVTAAVLGAVALRRPTLHGRATAGLLLGLAGLVVGFAVSIGAGAALSSASDAVDDSAAPVAAVDSASDADAADPAAAAGDGSTAITAVKAQRTDLTTQLEASIEKDAKKNVAKGLIEGPILDVSCTPVGGSTNPLTDLSTTFSCMVSTSKDDDGTEHGFDYSATMNWDEGSWTARYEG